MILKDLCKRVLFSRADVWILCGVGRKMANLSELCSLLSKTKILELSPIVKRNPGKVSFENFHCEESRSISLRM